MPASRISGITAAALGLLLVAPVIRRPIPASPAPQRSGILVAYDEQVGEDGITDDGIDRGGMTDGADIDRGGITDDGVDRGDMTDDTDIDRDDLTDDGITDD